MLLSTSISFKHYEGQEYVTVTLRQPTSSELNSFLKNRFLNVRNQIKNNVPEARIKLIDKILENVEGLEFESSTGEKVPLNKTLVLTDDDKAKWGQALGKVVESWKDLIPDHWKISWAMRFEENQPESESFPS